MAAFSEMGVMPEIAQAVEEMDWLLPTDIQAESIPLILGGGDVLMAAETGSGKTGAFSIPVIQIVYETLKDQQEGKKGKTTIKTGASVLNKWQMNPYDRGSAFAIGSDGLCCQSREVKEWHGCRATKGLTKGKHYYEVSCHDQGLCRVGWSSMQASLDLGTDKFGFGFGGTGKKSHNKQFDNYGEEFTMHDTIGCYLDIDKGHVKFSKNGKDLGLAFEIPPHMKNQALFPACVLKNAELKFNFGEEEFKFPPKDGFVALSKAPDSCVVKSQHTGNAQVAQTKFLPNAPKALIVEPSRELAEQTLNNVKQFKKYIDNPKLRELLIIGGVAARDQLSVLDNGVDIVVGTPGRLDDLVSTGKLNLSQVRFLVLDEADGLLSQGYSDFINRIHNQIPQITSDGKRLQVIVCSATLHSFDVKKLSEKIMHFPTWVDLKGEDSVPDTVHHVVVPVNPKTDRLWERLGKNHIRTDDVHAKDNTRPGANSPEMWSEAIKILKGEYAVRAIKEHKMDQAIIFCRTKIDCDNLEQYFMQQGGGPDKKGHQFSCVCLHGDRKPHERKQNLERFKKGDVRFLICTDVAARGIDIHGVPYVINVTLPDEKQNYVHRIGRVGRAERMGLAISLVATEKEKVWYHVCSSRGKGCYNTRLKEDGGCTIWYNEMQLLSEIEEHLNCTISQVEPDIKVPVDEFDGKVTYGQKRAAGGGNYKGHVDILAPTVQELAALEKEAQTSFLHLGYLPNQLFRTF
ncbi:ATP-dependent RNA helicase DDX1 [Mustela nigripes]|uniref:ATP-dependent RNA helicase n=2 Tax=Mustela TaxID=9665 RepID=A0A8U0MKV3_MUSPF|nr:ATP-dependent RNA helicase DDX1 [Mustela putorius furo]XP_032209156.1 ATP-dependent RNA helicase DDX1 isoform X1 [Mustela erminea]XP_044117986.1 ATP-dependent RNA helicase DDX1 [Neogale vison]XP_058988587.1 ATP-dependent RNA helicase DDX1 [Mustela lutreola]XP_059261158.1 ATP-dependent RNA helicase DDX1 [Mustela nigripes]